MVQQTDHAIAKFAGIDGSETRERAGWCTFNAADHSNLSDGPTRSTAGMRGGAHCGQCMCIDGPTGASSVMQAVPSNLSGAQKVCTHSALVEKPHDALISRNLATTKDPI